MVLDPWLPIGHPLGSDLHAGRLLYAGLGYQILSAGSSQHPVLVAESDTFRHWETSGLLSGQVTTVFHFGEREFGLVVPDSGVLVPMHRCPLPRSRSEALALATAIGRTRQLGITETLAQAVYLENAATLLPVEEEAPKLADDVLLGRYLTGGVLLSARDTRRMITFNKDYTQEVLSQFLEAARLESLAVVSTNNAAPLNKQLFSLPGRQELENFFREHIIDVVQHAEIYSKVGITFPGAFVLHGPPGCGKTFAVERLAEYLNWPVFNIESASVASPYIHETGRKIAEVFKQAKASAPAMVIIDEMEAFLPERNATPNVHSLEELAEFLRQLQDAGKQQVLVSAMTNRLDLIDAAVLRRGRFDHILEVGPAGKEEIVVLLEALLSKIPHEPIDVTNIAAILNGHPLSDASFVIREASRLTARENKASIDQVSIDLAATKVCRKENKTKRIGF